MARKRGLQGREELRKRLKLILRNVDDAVAEQTQDNAEDLLGRAQDLSPQLTGAHINSGQVVEISKLVRSVQFDKPYSVFLHEGNYKLGPISETKPPTSDGFIGREYLLRPFERHKRAYIERVGKAIDAAVRRSVR